MFPGNFNSLKNSVMSVSWSGIYVQKEGSVKKKLNSVEIRTKLSDHHFIVLITGFVDQIKIDVQKEMKSVLILPQNLIYDSHEESIKKREEEILSLPDNVDMENYYYESRESEISLIFNRISSNNDFMWYF